MEGKRPERERGGLGDAGAAVFAGKRRIVLNDFPEHLPRTRSKKTKSLHTNREWSRGASCSLIKGGGEDADED